MTGDRDYVLGTHDDEIARLGVQHRVWRPRVLDAWQRAGFTTGQTILDVGCGPGYAALDLADIVGPSGRVIAVDRSRRFLDALEAAGRARGLAQIATTEMDLDEAALPAGEADGAWCRWVAAFVKRPRDLVARIGTALRPGGVLVMHEYLDYGAWTLIPRSADFDEFVRLVIAGWRGAGGEPNVGLDLPGWLEDLGFRIDVRAIVDAIAPGDVFWQWPRAFVDVGLRRLIDLNLLTRDRAQAIWSDFLQREAAPHTRMLNPVVLEIIAEKITPSASAA